MTTRPPISPEVRALIESEREIRPVSPSQRARVLDRAREALAAPRITSARSLRTSGRPRWIAAAAAVAVSAAFAAAAYELHGQFWPAPAAREYRAPATVVTSAPATPVTPPPAVTPAPALADEPRPVPAREPTRSDTVREELRLLQQAREDVARDDFAAALRPLAEHARRFKSGRLTEEREALRVKALAGLGRTDEARHAAAAFRTRFPRSVLLPAVNRMVP
jgi:hypothetical protein